MKPITHDWKMPNSSSILPTKRTLGLPISFSKSQANLNGKITAANRCRNTKCVRVDRPLLACYRVLMSPTLFKAKSYRFHSIPEVTHIDRMGFWILTDSKERYLSFADFPWFRETSIQGLTHVKKESEEHLHWPELDVDLTIDMIDNPEGYPLKYK